MANITLGGLRDLWKIVSDWVSGVSASKPNVKVPDLEALLTTLNGKDFSTDGKLELVRLLLASLDGKNFATDTKLEAVRVLLNSINSKDFATETKLEAVRVLLNSLNSKNFATETTLAAMKTILTDGTQKVKVEGLSTGMTSAPVAGAKTVTAVAAEVFAGASRLANRYQMNIQNMGTVPIYIGASGVTTATGFPVNPGDCLEIPFRSSVATAIYGISEADCAIRVVELV